MRFFNKQTALLLTLSITCNVAGSCPFSGETVSSDAVMPVDSIHEAHQRHYRRLTSLSDDQNTRKQIEDIIRTQKRSVENNGCLPSNETVYGVTHETYESIRVSLDLITNSINDLGDRGHFIGGIVRIAAHDFMDFDQNAADQLGSDGCLDFSDHANRGLPDLWCDDAIACPYKALYDEIYSKSMSRADFWVAAANAVIKNASPNKSLDLPFRWGRIDSDNCPNSSGRLPKPGGCGDVEGVFINRMGLTWTDAVALMGAHTLGRGDKDFTGHDGTFVQNDEESTFFDKQYYQEVVNRGWRPDNHWTWGGSNRRTMMLNSDICLRFDIDDRSPCCTNTTKNCRNDSIQNVQCKDSSLVRPEAFAAFNEFAAGDGTDNDAFFSAYSSAWTQATENGYDSLNNILSVCDDNEGEGDVDEGEGEDDVDVNVDIHNDDGKEESEEYEDTQHASAPEEESSSSSAYLLQNFLVQSTIIFGTMGTSLY